MRSEPLGAGKSEEFRRRFKAMLRAAEREADRNGTAAAERVLAEVDVVIQRATCRGQRAFDQQKSRP